MLINHATFPKMIFDIQDQFIKLTARIILISSNERFKFLLIQISITGNLNDLAVVISLNFLIEYQFIGCVLVLFPNNIFSYIFISLFGENDSKGSNFKMEN